MIRRQPKRLWIDRNQAKEACRDKGITVALAGFLGLFFKSDSTVAYFGSLALIASGTIMILYGFFRLKTREDDNDV